MDSTQILQVAAEASQSNPINTYMLLACGLLGALLHFLKKAQRLSRQAGVYFDGWSFVKKEMLSIITSIVVIIGMVIARNEIKNLKIGSIVVSNFMYLTFIGLGYCSDSLIDWAFGGYEKAMRKAGKIK